MKRYLLFSGANYYASGGWDDFDGTFDSIEAARAAVLASDAWSDWYHIVDTETLQVAEHGGITRWEGRREIHPD